MTTPTRMPPYEVRNDGIGPYVVFFCEKCRREFRSAPLAGPSVPQIGRQAMGELLRKLPKVGETLGDTVAGSGNSKINLTLAQLAVGWSQVMENFQQCPVCNQVVCKEDFDARVGLCKEDRARRVKRCAACGAELKSTVRFCPQCGAGVDGTSAEPAAAKRSSRTTEAKAAEKPVTPAAEAAPVAKRSSRTSEAKAAEKPVMPTAEAAPAAKRNSRTTEAKAVTPATEAVSTRQYVIDKERERYEVLFTTGSIGCTSGGLDERLVKSIAAAKKTIDIAAFEFDLPRVAEALIKAHRRGVAVRMVTDTDYLEEQAIKDLKKAGVKVVDDKREAFMHDKFVVIDKEQVWTGSWNLTVNCTYRNNNNAIVIYSPELAGNYSAEFEEMFSGKKFGTSEGPGSMHKRVRLGSLLVENYFAPDDDVMAHILSAVDEAKKSVHFLAFSLTDNSLAKALTRKRKAGIEVRGVIESRSALTMGSELTTLRRAGVDVLPDGNSYAMHDKVIVIDGEIVITGSFNFTESARQGNDENILILHSTAIARKYEKEFQTIYEQAQAAKSS